MSAFIPNSFQLPNAYIDHYWHLLTSQEKDVLIYIARRTYGFGQSSDCIAWKQFTHGITTKDGRRLDYGVSMGRDQLQAALDGLIKYGFVVVVREAVKYPPSKRRAAEYSLQLDCERIDVESLQIRYGDRREGGRNRTAAARIKKEINKLENPRGLSHKPHGEVLSHKTNNLTVLPNKKSSTNNLGDYEDDFDITKISKGADLFEEFDRIHEELYGDGND